MNTNLDEFEKSLNRISNELCKTINGNFDITISDPYNNHSIQKLVMLINFLLDSARRSIKAEQEKGEYNIKLIAFNKAIKNVLKEKTELSVVIFHFIEAVKDTLSVDLTSFYQYDTSTNSLTSPQICCPHHTNAQHLFNKSKAKRLLGKLEKSTKPFFLHEPFSFFTTTKREVHAKFSLVIPVLYHKKLIGVIEAFGINLETFTKQQENLVAEISDMLGLLYGVHQEKHNYQLILDASSEAIYGLDSQGLITFTNPSACELFGYKKTELIGKPIDIIVDNKISTESSYNWKNCPIQSSLKNKQPVKINKDTFWHKEKHPITVSYTSTPILENDLLSGTVINLFDISQETFIKKKMEAINQIQNSYIQGLPIQNTYNLIVDSMLRLTESEHGFFGVLNSDTENEDIKIHSVRKANIHPNPGEHETTYFNDSNIELKAFESYIETNIKTGKVTVSNPHPHTHTHKGDSKTTSAISSYMGIPIIARQKMIALVGLSNRKDGYDDQVANNVSLLTSTLSSILDSHARQEEIDRMARLDALTGVHTRGYFEKRILNVIDKHKENNTRFAIMLLDLNKFKFINDKLGHCIGDKILQSFADRLVHALSYTDFIARIGGDEFIILIDDIEDSTLPGKIAQRIIQFSQEKYIVQQHEINCGVSIGIAIYPHAGKTYDLLMRNVDLALYQAKRENGYKYFSTDLEKAFHDKVDIETSFEKALKSNELFFLYQPHVCLNTGTITGAEALLRWRNKKGKLISPNDFIPASQAVALSEQLNKFVIKNTLDALKFNKDLLTPGFHISLNITPYVLKVQNHVDWIIDYLTNWRLENHDIDVKISLEIIETAFIDLEKNETAEHTILKFINDLKKIDITLAIDDFGVKYSSISRLIDYHFDIIKLDYSYVQQLDQCNNKPAKAVANAIITLAKGLEIEVIAEGVETKEQADILTQLHCKKAQGFYFYKPMALDKLLKILK